MWSSPFDKVMLAVGSMFVHRSSAAQHLKQYDSET
ncbi:hypothetical protein A2U01_0102495, partial [Trifolium medium]|nr:hypothetical protein [Trifolium medium]